MEGCTHESEGSAAIETFTGANGKGHIGNLVHPGRNFTLCQYTRERLTAILAGNLLKVVHAPAGVYTVHVRYCNICYSFRCKQHAVKPT